MELNTVQHDALVELLNIGFGRAGASLSKLTQQRVLLEVPQVAIHPITHLNQSLGKLVDERVASVHQVFSGPVAGDALLLLDPIAAATLTELLTDVPPLSMDLDPSSREVFTEVGNIVLNACIGTFGNMLDVPVSFSVPDVDVTNVHTVIDRMLDSGDALPLCPGRHRRLPAARVRGHRLCRDRPDGAVPEAAARRAGSLAATPGLGCRSTFLLTPSLRPCCGGSRTTPTQGLFTTDRELRHADLEPVAGHSDRAGA